MANTTVVSALVTASFFCLTQWSSFNLMQIFRLQLGLQETLLRCVKVISVFKLGEFQPSGSRVVPSFRRLPLTLTPAPAAVAVAAVVPVRRGNRQFGVMAT